MKTYYGLETSVDCPQCDGDALLHFNIVKRCYKDIPFQVPEHYYQCDKCDTKFTEDITAMLNYKNARTAKRKALEKNAG